MFGSDVLGLPQAIPAPTYEASAGFGVASSDPMATTGSLRPAPAQPSYSLPARSVSVSWTTPTWLRVTWAVASLAGGAAGAYHGYKRNKSVGWAIGWSILGSLAPFITVPVAMAQGFGKPKG